MLRARAIRKRGQGLNRYQTTDNRHQTKDMGKFFLVSFFISGMMVFFISYNAACPVYLFSCNKPY